jgi:phytoene synthase
VTAGAIAFERDRTGRGRENEPKHAREGAADAGREVVAAIARIDAVDATNGSHAHLPSFRPSWSRLTSAEMARAVLAAGSKSFALASKLLPSASRDDVAILYAWCRYADDAIDLAPKDARAEALVRLRRELDDAYAGVSTSTLVVDAFGALARRRAIPRAYPEALLDGFAMDVTRARYETLDDLLLYCFRVAGVVGAMMCHLIGLSAASALRPAVHLGIAMQLTNVCRDVAEDADDGRLYLPATTLNAAPSAVLADRAAHRATIVKSVARLLKLADRYYASADRGMIALPFRAALAVRTARLVYAAIGHRLLRRGGDPLRGRTVVPLVIKLWLVLRAIIATALELPARARRPFRPALLVPVRFPDDVVDP